MNQFDSLNEYEKNPQNQADEVKKGQQMHQEIEEGKDQGDQQLGEDEGPKRPDQNPTPPTQQE